jgi:hypothetical protein
VRRRRLDVPARADDRFGVVDILVCFMSGIRLV